jgi:hypothetical protein
MVALFGPNGIYNAISFFLRKRGVWEGNEQLERVNFTHFE